MLRKLNISPRTPSSSARAASSALGHVQLAQEPASAAGKRGKRGKLYRPMPIIDTGLSMIFVAQCVWVLVLYANAGAWAALGLLASLGGVAAVVSTSDMVSDQVGQWLGNVLVRARAVDEHPLRTSVQRKKWREQSWQFVIHVGMSLLELYVLSGQDWWSNTSSMWTPDPRIQVQPFSVHALYTIQLAVWVYTAAAHVFVHERIKDYQVMLAHHVVTIGLVASSAMWGYYRVGVAVLLVHDVSDIGVDLLKLVNYLKLEGSRGWYASELAYATCMLGWLYMRMYEFPVRILPSSSVESWNLVSKPCLHAEGHTNIGVGSHFSQTCAPGWWQSNALLFTLMSMHIFWTYLLGRIGWKVAFQSARSASEQEYEGSEE